MSAVHITSRPHAFADVRHAEVPEGATLERIVATVAPELRPEQLAVTLEGELVDRAFWPRVRPKAGRNVAVIPIPRGSSGGEQKNTLAIVLAIVVSVVAVAAGQVYGPAVAGALHVTSQAGVAAVSAGLAGLIGDVGMLDVVAPPSRPS